MYIYLAGSPCFYIFITLSTFAKLPINDDIILTPLHYTKKSKNRFAVPGSILIFHCSVEAFRYGRCVGLLVQTVVSVAIYDNADDDFVLLLLLLLLL